MIRLWLTILATVYCMGILVVGCAFLAQHYHSALFVLPIPAIVITAGFIIGYFLGNPK